MDHSAPQCNEPQPGNPPRVIYMSEAESLKEEDCTSVNIIIQFHYIENKQKTQKKHYIITTEMSLIVHPVHSG